MKTAPLTGALCGLSAMGIYCLYDVGVKFLSQDYSPIQVLFCATLFFMPLILGQVALVDRTGLRPALPRWTVLRVVVTTVNGVLGAYAFAVLPLAQAYAVFFLMPLMISALAVPMLGEPMDLGRSLAILAGFAGVIIALDPRGAALGTGTGGTSRVCCRGLALLAASGWARSGSACGGAAISTLTRPGGRLGGVWSTSPSERIASTSSASTSSARTTATARWLARGRSRARPSAGNWRNREIKRPRLLWQGRMARGG